MKKKKQLKKGDKCNISPMGYYLEPYRVPLSGCYWCKHVRLCFADLIAKRKKELAKKRRAG